MGAQTTGQQLANNVVRADYDMVFENAGDALLLIHDSRIVDGNRSALDMFGLTHKACLGLQYPADLSPSMQPDGVSSHAKGQEWLAAVSNGGKCRFEWLHARADSESTFWTDVTLAPVPHENALLICATIHSVAERKRTEQAYRLQAQVFTHGRQAIVIADTSKVIISANPAFTHVTGFPNDGMQGCPLSDVLQVLLNEENGKKVFEEVNTIGFWEGEAWDRRKNGQIYPQWLSITAVRREDGEIVNYIAAFSDITERKTLEERTRHLAEHDFLTGLPNRILLIDRLSQAIASAKRNHTQFALIFVDLDRFKFINDSMGHFVGDKLLQEVARRLRKCVRAIDTVSRQGGDEFVILLADIGNAKQVACIAQNIMNALGRMMDIDGRQFSITASIGISTYPTDGEDMDTLIRNADIAMYYAKENGRNGCQFFNDEINARIRERVTLEQNLRSALEMDEFCLHYQPEFDFSSGRIVGAEALIRWNHPDMGRLPPTRFIAAAEECGLISLIGEWVLRRACQQAKLWHDQGFPIVVSVNFSTAQFRQKRLLQTIQDELRLADLAPQFLTIEVTEGLLLSEHEEVCETMQALKSMGVKLAVDDFGTGYSSLSYLKRFQVDKLKIDQSFVSGITGNPKDTEIIRAIVAMAKSLALQVVAEGVETAEQFHYLQSIGCDGYQGFFSSQAVPAPEIVQLPSGPGIVPQA